MNLQTPQYPTAISSALTAHFRKRHRPRPVIVTVAQFAERNPAFTTRGGPQSRLQGRAAPDVTGCRFRQWSGGVRRPHPVRPSRPD